MHNRRDSHTLAPRQFGGVYILLALCLLNYYEVNEIDKFIYKLKNPVVNGGTIPHSPLYHTAETRYLHRHPYSKVIPLL